MTMWQTIGGDLLQTGQIIRAPAGFSVQSEGKFIERVRGTS